MSVVHAAMGRWLNISRRSGGGNHLAGSGGGACAYYFAWGVKALRGGARSRFLTIGAGATGGLFLWGLGGGIEICRTADMHTTCTGPAQDMHRTCTRKWGDFCEIGVSCLVFGVLAGVFRHHGDTGVLCLATGDWGLGSAGQTQRFGTLIDTHRTLIRRGRRREGFGTLIGRPIANLIPDDRSAVRWAGPATGVLRSVRLPSHSQAC